MTEYVKYARLGAAYNIAFSPAAPQAALVSNSAVTLLDLDEVKVVAKLRVAHPSSVAYAPDGRRLLVKDPNGNLFLFDPTTGEQLTALHFSIRNEGADIRYSADGVILDASWNGTLDLRDPETLTSRKQFTSGKCTGLQFLTCHAATGRYIIAGSYNHGHPNYPNIGTFLVTWQYLFTAHACQLSPRTWWRISGISIHPNGSTLAVVFQTKGQLEEQVEIIDINTWQTIGMSVPYTRGGYGSTVAWSPDGATLATCRKDAVVLCDAETLCETQRYAIDSHHGIHYSTDGKYLAICATRKAMLLRLS